MYRTNDDKKGVEAIASTPFLLNWKDYNAISQKAKEEEARKLAQKQKKEAIAAKQYMLKQEDYSKIKKEAERVTQEKNRIKEEKDRAYKERDIAAELKAAMEAKKSEEQIANLMKQRNEKIKNQPDSYSKYINQGFNNQVAGYRAAKSFENLTAEKPIVRGYMTDAKVPVPIAEARRHEAPFADMGYKEPTVALRGVYGAKAIGNNTLGAVPVAIETAFTGGDNKESLETIRKMKEQQKHLLDEFLTYKKEGAEGTQGYIRTVSALEALTEQIRILESTAPKEVSKDGMGTKLMSKGNGYYEKYMDGLEGGAEKFAEVAYGVGDQAANVIISGGRPDIAIAIQIAKAIGSKTYELNERGYDPEYAFWRGVLSGGLELATGYKSVKSLTDIIKYGGKNILKAAGSQGLQEGIEEGLSYGANYLADKALKDPNASFNWGDLGHSMFVGGMSGGVMGAGGQVSHNLAFGKNGDGEVDAENMKAPQQGVQYENPQLRPQVKQGEIGAFNPQGENVLDYIKQAQTPIVANDIRDAQKGTDNAPLDALNGEMSGLTKPKQQMEEAENSVEVTPPIRQKELKTAIEESGKRLGVTQGEIDKISSLGSRMNVEIAFVDKLENGAMGKYENGKILIAKDCKNPATEVLKHELTHHIESSGGYEALSNYIFEYANSKEVQTDAVVLEIKKRYEEHGVRLDETDAKKEFVAEFVAKNLFTNQKAITDLATHDVGLVQTVKRWVHDMVVKFKATPQEKVFLKMEGMYEKALLERSAPKNTDKAFENVKGDKKRTKTWLSLNRLQLPFGITKYGSTHNVSYRGDLVNYNSAAKNDGKTNRVKTPMEVAFERANEGKEAGRKPQYSINPAFESEYDSWVDGGRKRDVTLEVSKTSEALKSIGVKNQTVYWDTSKINRILEKHKTITDEVLKQVPNLLEKPVMILASKTVKGRVILFGEVYDSANIPVMAALELEPTGQNSKIVLNHMKVASAYSRLINEVPSMKPTQNIINDSEILYIEPDKKRTNAWLSRNKLQLPFGITKYGSTHNVSYGSDLVNYNSVTKNDGKTNRVKTPMEVAFERANEGKEGGRKPQYSINPAFESEYDSWVDGGRKRDVTLEVSKTSEALKSIGVKNQTVYWDTSKINRILEKHKTITDEVLKQVPNLLEKPVMILASKTVKGRVILFGEVYDSANIPVMAALELEPTGQNSKIVLNHMKVASAYSKLLRGKPSMRPTQSLIDESEILYIEPDKKRTNAWLSRNKLQLPFGITKYGSTHNVSYRGDLVNYNSVTKNDGKTNRVKTPMEVAFERANEGKKAGRQKSLDIGLDMKMEAMQKDFGRSTYEKPMRENTGIEPVKQAYEKARQLERQLARAREKNPLTQKENYEVEGLLKGMTTIEEMQKKEGLNVKGIVEVYEGKKAVRDALSVVEGYNANRKQALTRETEYLVKNSDSWNDKKMGLLYARETMERNILGIAKKDTNAQKVVDTYITPIHDHEAQSNRMKNEYRNRIRKLKLTASESEAVQFWGETDYEIGKLIQQQETRKLSQQKENRLIDLKAKQRDYREKHQTLNMEKVNGAVLEFRRVYDELFEQMNDILLENGYRGVDYRKGYFPHFSENKPDGLIGKIASKLGMKVETNELPTDIAGLTHTFRPGKKWNANLLQRKGNETVYDALEGFDKYIEGAGDIIHHTGDIQKLRVFENTIRSKYSDDGTQAEIEEIKNDLQMDEELKQLKLDELYKRDVSKLSHFVTELRRYTDNLAGKKDIGDRTWEHDLGRGIYSVMQSLENRVAANMVAINPGSWLTNYIPITQAWSATSTKNMGKAMVDTAKVSTDNLLKAMKLVAKDAVTEDGFAAKSAFLTNRRGSDPLVRSGLEKASDALSSPMQWIDGYTSSVIVRARYYDNLERGMNGDAAMRDADRFAASVMADRSKGALPTIFNKKNPIAKTLTMFQVEVNNQLSFLFKDMPKEQKQKGVLALATALTKFLIGAFAYNELYERLVGRRPALDPIGMFLEAFGEFEDEEKKTSTAIKNTTKAVLEELPFLGGLLGGGRIPVSSALPDFSKMIPAMTGEMNEKKAKGVLLKEAAKPLAYLLPPFGGGQVKKAIEGGMLMKNGGMFGVDTDGRDELKFPVLEKTPQKAMQAMLFGPYATNEGREYIAGGFKPMSANDTAVYKKAIEKGMKPKVAIDTIKTLNAVVPQRGIGGKIIKERPEIMQNHLLNNTILSREEKELLHMEKVWTQAKRDAYAKGEGVKPNYSDKFELKLSLETDSFREKAQMAKEMGVDTKTFVEVSGGVKEAVAKAKEKNPALKGFEENAVKREYLKRSGLSVEVKNVMDDILINDGFFMPKDVKVNYASEDDFVISQMSEAAQRKWKLVDKGEIGPQEYKKYYEIVSRNEGKKDGKIDELVNEGMTERQAYAFWNLIQKR